MKKCYLFLSLFFLFATTFYSQQWIWDTTVSATYGYPWYHSVVKDPYKHVYHFGEGDTILVKVNYSGQTLLVISVPKKIRMKAVACSPDSSVYMLATFTGTFVFGGTTLSSRGLEDICIIKYNQSGVIQWVVQAGSSGQETATDICMNGTDFIITGSASDTLHFPNKVFQKSTQEELFIGKYKSNGQFDTAAIATQVNQNIVDWSKGVEVETDGNGNILLLAEFSGITNFAATSFSNYHSFNVVKLDQSMNLLANNQICYYYTDVPACMMVNKLNEIYLVINSNYKYSKAFEIHKLPNSLSSKTLQYAHPGVIAGMDLDSCNNVYFAGETFGGTYPEGGPYPYFTGVGMLSPSGILNWLRQDKGYNTRMFRGIANLGINKCYVTAFFHDTLNLVNMHVAPPQMPGFVCAIIQATFGLPANVTPMQNLYLCANKNTTLSCNTGGALSWYSSVTSTTALFSGNNFVTPTLSAGQYTWYADASTCTMTTGRVPVTVTVNPNPTVILSNASICKGSSYTLQPSGALSYSFSSGSAVITPTKTNTYSVTGTDAAGCSAKATCTVQVNGLPSLSVTTSNTLPCAGTSVTLTASGAQTYLWSGGGNSGVYVINPSLSATYWLQGTDANGCVSAVLHNQLAFNCSGLSDQEAAQNIRIFPIPCNDFFTISSPYPSMVIIFDGLGRRVKSFKVEAGSNIIPADELASGVYTLITEGNGFKNLQKLIVE